MRVRGILIAVSLALLGLVAARAEEEATLEARLYQVGALTAGSLDFLPHGLPIVSPDLVSDEDAPLFGSESKEPRYPVGDLESLVHLLHATVAPAFWEEVEDAAIEEIHGEGLLLVHATPAVHAELGRTLAGLEQRFLSPVVVDVRAARVPLSRAPARLVLTDEEAGALLGEGAVGPAVQLTVLPGQRGFAFDGAETAYLQDGDVEVSQTAMILDPIIGVMSLGLGATARAFPSDDRRTVSLSVRILLAQPTAPRSQTDRQGFRYDLPSVHTTEARTRVTVPVGAWVLLDGQGAEGDGPGWSFLVRARTAAPLGGTQPAGLPLPRVPEPTARRGCALRLFEVGDLLRPREHRVGWSVDLAPSNFAPPEPAELPEPEGALSDDALVQLLHETVAPASWEGDEADLGLWGEGTLMACNAPAVLEAVGDRIGLLRRALSGSLVTTAEVVEVPAALAGALGRGPGGALSAEDADRLDAAIGAGTAHVIDRARVTSSDGVRNHVRSGITASYLQDYEVEIQESAAIPNPVIQTAFSGLLLDVAATRTSDLAGAHVTLRVDRSRLEEPIRMVETPHGGLDLPTLHLLRVRSDLTVPLGRRVVAAAAGRGERSVLLLLTVRWMPVEAR